MSITPSNLGIKILIIILFVMVFGFTLFYTRHNSLAPVLVFESRTQDYVTSSKNEDQPELIKETDQDSKVGTYEQFDTLKVEDDSSDSRTILFFNAAWSAESVKLNSLFLDLKIKEGIKILSVDFDKFTSLKDTYKILYPNTFIEINSHGEEINRWDFKQSNRMIEDIRVK